MSMSISMSSLDILKEKADASAENHANTVGTARIASEMAAELAIEAASAPHDPELKVRAEKSADLARDAAADAARSRSEAEAASAGYLDALYEEFDCATARRLDAVRRFAPYEFADATQRCADLENAILAETKARPAVSDHKRARSHEDVDEDDNRPGREPV